MKLIFINFLVLTLFIPVFLPAQLAINLPATIEITVNKQIIHMSSSRLDSLRRESRSGKVHYKIAGIEASQQRAQVRIYVPQIFSLSKVFDQVIFYYSLISTEDDRRRDHVYVYPYFSDIDKQPYVTCTYQPGGKFFFTVNHWSVAAVPPAPDPQQILIYNQIIEEMLNDYQIMESINLVIIKRVAEKNKLPLEQVQKIYENTILWQEAQ